MESRADLTKLRVVDLKQRLSEYGLPVGGLKAELVNRLFQHLSTNVSESGNGEGEEQEESSSSNEDNSEGEDQPERSSPEPAQEMENESDSQSPDEDVTHPEVSAHPEVVAHPEVTAHPEETAHEVAEEQPQQVEDADVETSAVDSPPAAASPPAIASSPASASPPAIASPPPPAPPMASPPRAFSDATSTKLSSAGSVLPNPPPLMSLVISPTPSMFTPAPVGAAAPSPRPAPVLDSAASHQMALARPPQPPVLSPSPQQPPSLLSTIIPKPPGLESDMLMQHKVRQQQMLLEQQKKTQKQDDLFRLQQQALLEKQKEENEKQAHLLRLQQEALKQNEDEQKQLQALGLQHNKPATVAGEESSTSGQPNVAGAISGVNALIAAMQRQPPAVPLLQQSAALSPAASMMTASTPGLLPRPPAPPMAASPIRPMSMAPRPPGQVGLMGHSPIRSPKVMGPRPGGESTGRAGPGPNSGNLRHHGGMTSPPDSLRAPRHSSLRHQQVAVASDETKPPPLMSLQVSAPPEDNKDVRLPQALEEALAYKHQRAKQVGVSLEEVLEDAEDTSDRAEAVDEDALAEEIMEFNEWMPASTENVDKVWSADDTAALKDVETAQDEEDPQDDEEEEEDEADDSAMEIIAVKINKKNDKTKRKKKKKKKKAKSSDGKSWIQKQLEEEMNKREEGSSKKSKSADSKVEIRYVQEEIQLDYSDPMHRHFAKIFENFKISEPVAPVEEETKTEAKVESPVAVNMADLKKVPKLAEDDDSDNEDDGKPKVSKRKLKLQKRMSIAELKQTVNRPDVVEMHDVTARDPKLLVHLKATRNTVPVPRHWCFKRKYLQGKRGIEKPPFELPDFIKRTGIMEMRAALQEKEDQKTLKAKMRDKVRPKMGKIDIDYQKLHDAFFKWQCKPEMTIHGDLYYEGKEFETKMKDKKPGEMSDDLRIALGMPVGANAHKVPPPWLIAMQRYGPPPSYPNLKIPGLNAPIPDSCSFGYHAGGWGKPPVDNMGKPIYGDVFGTQNKENEMPMVEEEVEKSLWGELESESEEESEEEESSEEEEDNSGLVTPGETGLVTPSGISSMPAGLETPDMIELRKKHLETEVEGGETPALYTILPEKRVEGGARAMMASTHTYDLSSAMGGGGRAANQGVDVALDPSELDLVDTDAMAARYEATLREQQTGEDEDFSDMVAEHAAKQRNKRRRLQHQENNKPAKKYKDFKF